VYVSYTVPDIAVPGAVEAVGSFAELAVESEVRRLVLISGRGEEEAQRAERVVQEVSEKAGVEWTIVRCSWFSQNFSESYFLEPILGGEVVLPAGDPRAVRRCRRHRRCRRRGADGGRARRAALRADRSPAPDLRRGDRRDLPCDWPQDPFRAGLG
jgi:uncharacterized protein YbjT (DUF2867 family)